MEKDKTGLERTILLATSVVGGIGGLFAAINGLSDSFRKAVGIFAGFSEWQLGVAALVLVAVSWWLFRLSRRRRSILLRPEALRLERANPAHLFGRREDIDQLVRLCREEPLVFLEGESGAGKSALLQAGLVPALRGHPGLLPIYVESLVGSDWERDPRIFLATALWSALDEAFREMMGLKTVPGASAVRAALEAVPAKLGRTPLILLDQFDDYQLRHHERFLSRKTWLKPGKLSELNGFWRDLRELLASSTIHLVVVTRTDTAAGLSSVRFAEPETYRLDWLNSLFVGPLLAELARDQDGQKVIADTDYGWTSLQARLSADLERSGTILPQQLKIVLAGLGTLPGRVLTVAAYERADGTAGLEARFIEDRIAKAARLRGLTEERVRAALLTLVDPLTGQKTAERPSRELLSGIDPTAPESARPVLDLLAQDEVIRRRVEPRTGESSWLLDHDYLARAVLEADRRANRWQRALSEGAKALADAGSWTRRWRALLPPTTQLGFLHDRLRGRFRYGEHRAYAARSLQRFGPMLAAFLLIAAVGTYEWERRAEAQVAKSADDILNVLRFEQNKIDEGDAGALLRLASADEKARQRTLALVLTDPNRARFFIRQPEAVIRAIAAVSPRYRDLSTVSLADALVAFPINRPELAIATPKAASLLGRPEVVPLDWLLTAIKTTTNPGALQALGAGLGAVAAKLSDKEAREAVEPFLAALKTITNPFAAQALGAGLGALPVKLSDQAAKEAVEPFLAALKTTTRPDALRALGVGLGAFPAKLSDRQAKEAVEPFLAALKTTTSPDALRALGAGLGAVAAKFSDSQAKEAVEPFLAAIKGTTDPDALGALGAGLAAVTAKLSASQAKEAVEPFLAAVKTTTVPYALGALGAGLGAVTAKLSDSQAKEAVEPFLAAIKGTTDPYALRALGAGLGAVPAKLSDSQAKEAVEPFLAAIKGTTNPYVLPILGAGLGAVTAKLSDQAAKEAVEPFIAALKTTTSPDALGALGAGLGALAANLSDSQAKEAVEPFLAALKTTTGPLSLGALGAVLRPLAAKLSDSQAKEAVEPFLSALKTTTSPDALGALGAGLGALAAKLSDSQAKEAVEPFLAALKTTTDPNALWPLGAGLEAVAAKLDRQSANNADSAVDEVLERIRDGATLAIYSELSAKLAYGEPADLQITKVFRLLRHPLTAGEPASKLLALLEQVFGVQTQFGGDLWKAVEWAEAEQKASRLKDLDLDAPLKIR
jgi:chaperone required for assembly of F1-ATPase